MINVATASGSLYQFDEELTQVCRLKAGLGTLRRDGEWMFLVSPPVIELGKGIAMYLMLRDDGIITLRQTNEVTDITTEAVAALEPIDAVASVD